MASLLLTLKSSPHRQGRAFIDLQQQSTPVLESGKNFFGECDAINFSINSTKTSTHFYERSKVMAGARKARVSSSEAGRAAKKEPESIEDVLKAMREEGGLDESESESSDVYGIVGFPMNMSATKKKKKKK